MVTKGTYSKKRGGENLYLLLIRPRDIPDAFYPAYGLNH